mmetsp:Transcript_41315/g.70275  ORF Transcript_41315/g.70275 Transcript_41315/m.70275 type:complete len:220 (-) Transcript_41315:164-823(-)
MRMLATIAMLSFVSKEQLAFKSAAGRSHVLRLSVDPRGDLVDGPQISADQLIGVDLETLNQVFDPLDLASETESLFRRRCVEIKHGRVAMAAVLGMLVSEAATFPGYVSFTANLKFSDVPPGLGALRVLPPVGWLQIFLFVGVLELGPFKQSTRPGAQPGDVAGELWKRYDDDEVRASKLLIELKNGRLAMLGVMGMLVSEAVTGQTVGVQISSGNAWS